VHLVGFIITIYHDAQSSLCQIKLVVMLSMSLKSIVIMRGKIPVFYCIQLNIHLRMVNTRIMQT